MASLAKKYNDNLAAASAKYNADVNTLKTEKDTFVSTLTKEADEKFLRLDKYDDLEKQLRNSKVIIEGLKDKARLNDAQFLDWTLFDEKKGEVVKKDGDFVTLNVGRAQKLRVGTRFLVLSSTASVASLREKEEKLNDAARSGSQLRNPFDNHPDIKANVEVVEVFDNTSRAKIVDKDKFDLLRNPVQVKDQAFNLLWVPNETVHVAVAGIIDTDGDGLDNNTEFVQILENLGVEVDEILDLREKTIRKKRGGMSLRTRFIIMGEKPRLEDAGPEPLDKNPVKQQMLAILSKMNQMESDARSKGVQIIDARKFLAMMGYRLPAKAEKAQYGSVAYDGVAPPPPAPEPKPDDKKD